MRKYKSGTKWCVWRLTKVNKPNGDPYLTRLHILKTPWFSVYLHWIYSADYNYTKEGWIILHNHPVDFLSIVLSGYYSETLNFDKETFLCAPILFWNWIPHYKKHHICYVSKNTLTLCPAGPARHKWGYFVMDDETEKVNFIEWDKYNHEQKI